MEQKASGFQRIIIRDESRFFYYSRDLVRLASLDQLLQRIGQKIDTEKCLVSILRSVNGIHGLLDVPKWTVYNPAFFPDAVMPCLIENIGSRTRRKGLKGRLIHMDNAHPYNSGLAQR
jgi:hypothetical protein